MSASIETKHGVLEGVSLAIFACYMAAIHFSDFIESLRLVYSRPSDKLRCQTRAVVMFDRELTRLSKTIKTEPANDH